MWRGPVWWKEVGVLGGFRAHYGVLWETGSFVTSDGGDVHVTEEWCSGGDCCSSRSIYVAAGNGFLKALHRRFVSFSFVCPPTFSVFSGVYLSQFSEKLAVESLQMRRIVQEMVFVVYPTFAFFCLLSPCSWVSWFPLRAQSLGFKSTERLEVLGRLRQVWVIRLDPVVSSTTFCLCTRRINGVLCLLWKKKQVLLGQQMSKLSKKLSLLLERS